jgi:hypothetical protein
MKAVIIMTIKTPLQRVEIATTLVKRTDDILIEKISDGMMDFM